MLNQTAGPLGLRHGTTTATRPPNEKNADVESGNKSEAKIANAAERRASQYI